MLDAERMSRALEILATTLPALMVVDMVMPGSSTLEAVRQLKVNPSTATLPIVALTASPPSAPQDRALFAEVVAKPTDARALLDVIAAILRNGNAGTSTA